MKTEMKQCACVKCKNVQPEVLIYEEVKCKNILHGILTFLTLIWGFLWAVSYSGAKKKNISNMQNALSQSKCDKCNGSLMLLSQ